MNISSNKLNNLIFIQTRLRYLYNQKIIINRRLDVIYKILTSIIKNIQYLYLHKVITQASYNSSMYLLENIFNNFRKLPRSIKIYDFKDIKIYQFRDIIFKLKNDLLKFTNNHGCVDVGDIIKLNILLDKFNKSFLVFIEVSL